jgi:hypothetical protein
MIKSNRERELALDGYDMSFVWEKVLSENKISFDELPSLELEFKRFMKLVLREPGPLAMIDRRIDELWHSFILFTPQYRKFCEEVMGFFVDHQPRTSLTPAPPGAIANFVDAYTRHFKYLPDLWLEHLDPTMRDMIRTGNIPQKLSFNWSGWTGHP